ncbi:hypothetical protein M2146_001033 [Lachnospiraceae bacterium PF1-22]
MKKNLKRIGAIALMAIMAATTVTGCSNKAKAEKETPKKETKLEVTLTGEQVTVVAGEDVSVEKFIKEINKKDAEVTFAKAKAEENPIVAEEKVVDKETSKTVAAQDDKYNKKNVPTFTVSYEKAEKVDEVITTEVKEEKVESKIKVVAVDEIAKYAKGITDNVNVLKGAKDIDLAKSIEFDKTKIKSITVDDSKVNYKKAGTYDVVYTITTTDDKKVEVPVQVIVVDENTAKDMANNGETVIGGSGKEVEKTEDKKDDKKEEDKKEEDKKSEDTSKDTSKDKDSSKDTSKKDDNNTSSTGNSGSNNSGSSNTGNSGSSNTPSTPSTPSDPNAGKKQVWVVDVPARAEQGHTEDQGWYEDHYSHSVIQCYCGAEFSDYGSWVSHSDANFLNGCNGYRTVQKYNTVWVPNPVYVIDVPAQAEQGHYEWR